MLRRTLLSATAAIFSVALTVGLSAPAQARVVVPRAGYGFTEGAAMLDLPQSALDRELDAVSHTSASWLRVLVDWSRTETAPGNFDWSAADRVVNSAHRHGLRILLNVAFTPAWAGGGSGLASTTAPRNAADFGNFAGAVARRYQGLASSYEIWNEPNLPTFLNAPNRPAAYAALLRAAYPAIKRVQPDATVVAAGLSPSTGSDFPASFLEAVYGYGAKGYFDATAMHPYTFPYGLPADPSGGWHSVGAMHATMQAHGDGSKKIWLTEFGAPTNYTELTAVSPVLGGVTPEAQAVQIGQILAAAANTPYVGPAFIYSIRDIGGADAPSMLNREDHFGALLTNDWRPKPAAGLLAR
ncbi:hypothetical protein GCM10027169_17510 [Gordonia jinhuaensis]|uniref:Cellulase (Glycosyl hydrolase family 5) n=1 Tax=Gordonia jinhuaensis TaxID=1517702 RepID=A0A916X1B4_9ACTN|nr:cellulase family glycosylhydrolase [Gordonia jinhuaensis]GGB47318.1 hypothetical protein GCM10011489_38180 [Gordonia jinhuaensis]